MFRSAVSELITLLMCFVKKINVFLLQSMC